VSRAATKIGLSQPAMSHALARLRDLFGDPLLVRTTRGMQPTPRAEEIAAPLSSMLDEVARIVAPPAKFDPARSKRRFDVVADDYSELVLLPEVLARAWRAAPDVDVNVRPSTGNAVADLVEGRADLAIIPARSDAFPRGIYTQKLFHEDFVCVLREGHPHTKKKISLDEYVALPHALIAPRGEGGSIVDASLRRLGRSRRVALAIPHFLAAPHLLVGSDLVLMLGTRVAKKLAAPLGLRVLAPPSELELTGFDVALAWHERMRADPAHAWFRAVVAAAAKAL